MLPGAAAGAAVVVLAFASGGYFASDHGLLTLAFLLVVLTAVLGADRVSLDRHAVALVGGLAGLALWALVSAAWAPAAAWPVLEAERGLLYVAAAAALVLAVTKERVWSLLAGLVAGTTVVAVYALATRLYPGDVGGAYDPSSGYQLAEPIGYWNALGLLLALALPLAAGLALRGRAALRALAGAALVPLAVALYFTFSRGAVVALAVAALLLLALERERWWTAAGHAFLGLAPAAGILLASRAPALTRAGETLATAQAQGHRLSWQLALLCSLGAGAAWGYPHLAARTRLPRVAGRVAFALAGLAASGFVLAALVRAGGPVDAADRALEAFRREPPAATGALDRRLLSVSGHGRADYWRVAVRMVEREPLFGEGAGSFERRWVEERPVSNNARDAHNLYLETLAELGPVGLALLIVALGTPLLSVRRARSAALGPAAAAAYGAFLLHAAVDWDWELPLLVLFALACAVTLIVQARVAASVPLTVGRRAAGILVVTCGIGVALVAHVGNRAAADSVDALARGDTSKAAAAARRARTWAPWSHEPWQLLGEAQLAARDDAAARRSLREAARRAPEEWRVWLDLALVENEPERTFAITRARELNPLGSEAEELEHR